MKKKKKWVVKLDRTCKFELISTFQKVHEQDKNSKDVQKDDDATVDRVQAEVLYTYPCSHR